MNARLSRVEPASARALRRTQRHALLGASIDWLLPATLLVTGMSLRLVGELTPVVLGTVMLAAMMLRPAGAALLSLLNLALAALVVQVPMDDGAVLAVFPVAIGFLAQRRRQPVERSDAGKDQALSHAVFDRCPEGVVVLDDRAQVVMANGAFRDMVGHGQDALTGASVMLWQSERALAHWRELIRSGDIEARMDRMEAVYQRKDGSRFPVEVSARAVMVDGARHAIAYVRDVSDRRAGDHARARETAIMTDLIESQHRDLTHARAEAASVARAKDCFLANVSHQIRTPLHAIKAFSSLGMRVPSDDTGRLRGYLERIQAGAEEMSGFVDDLMILGSLKPDAAAWCFEKLDVGLLLQQACMDMHERLIGQTLTLETDIRIKGRLKADARLMERLVAAMLTHGCTRAPAGSVIGLTARFQAGEGRHTGQPGFLIEVTDGGGRLATDTLPCAFEAYFEAELLDSQAAGTALLLAICRQIARLHGGQCALVNTAGGVALRAWLPVTSDDDSGTLLDSPRQ